MRKIFRERGVAPNRSERRAEIFSLAKNFSASAGLDQKFFLKVATRVSKLFKTLRNTVSKS